MDTIAVTFPQVKVKMPIVCVNTLGVVFFGEKNSSGSG